MMVMVEAEVVTLPTLWLPCVLLTADHAGDFPQWPSHNKSAGIIHGSMLR